MTSRALKIALAASVALNLFAVGCGVAVFVAGEQVGKRVDAQHRAGRETPAMVLIDGLDPEVRDRVRSTLRASALAARPDFEQARSARREAIDLARADAYDPAAVSVLLARSREAEMRGRGRLETEAVTLLDTLEADDRQALSAILSRHAQRGRGGRPSGGEARPRGAP